MDTLNLAEQWGLWDERNGNEASGYYFYLAVVQSAGGSTFDGQLFPFQAPDLYSLPRR